MPTAEMSPATNETRQLRVRDGLTSDYTAELLSEKKRHIQPRAKEVQWHITKLLPGKTEHVNSLPGTFRGIPNC